MDRKKVWFASALPGSLVRNSSGEDLGKVEDFVVNPASGQIIYAILSFGGFLGLGDKLFVIPWTSLELSPSNDYIVLDVDRRRLEDAPGFDRGHWPDMTDPTWQDRVNGFYGVKRPALVERPVYVDRPVRATRKGISIPGAVLLVLLLVGLLGTAFLIRTRGWDQTKDDLSSYFQGAAYAAKETSHDVALTAKVKTAFSLSKRIPADQINVDSAGDVVTLRGDVASDDVRSLAENIARDTPGVGEVHNHLYVISPRQ